ncbi:MAG: hypothetical protein JNK53_00385, partial [Phycisphaerae bacterium]|nr:hypothetical protein [Phycisphaerae bacterium]
MSNFPSDGTSTRSSGLSGALRNGIAWVIIVACTVGLAWQAMPHAAAPGSEKPHAVAESNPQMDIVLQLANGAKHPDAGGDAGPTRLFVGADKDLER